MEGKILMLRNSLNMCPMDLITILQSILSQKPNLSAKVQWTLMWWWHEGYLEVKSRDSMLKCLICTQCKANYLKLTLSSTGKIFHGH